ncbi:MAG: hypothetical protein U0167_06055 [bacterium]
MSERARGASAPLAVLSLAFVALTAFYVFFRREMLDEGWYLLAGRLAWRGEVPIRDFAYFQSPLLPYLYGVSQRIAPGLLSGRVLAAAATLGTWLVVLRMTRRLAGAAAVPWAAGAMLTSVYFLSHFPLALTYAPGAFFLVAALDAATRGQVCRAVLFATVAAGVRLSLAPALPILAVAAFRESARRSVDAARLVASLALAAGVAVFFVLPDPEVARFCLVGYHVQGATAADRIHAVTSSALDALRSGGALFLPALAAPFLAKELRHRGLVGAIFGAILLANLAPATTAAYYQSVLAPVAALLAAPVLAGLRPRGAAAAILALHLGAQGVTAVRQNVAVRAAHGVLPFEERLSRLHAVGRDVASRSSASPVWTLDPYFALEADRGVVPGLAMGIFSVQADWPTERCRRFHVVNGSMLRSQLADAEAEVVVLSALDVSQLGGRDGPVLSALPRRYAVRARYEDVGQFDGPVFLFERRAPRAVEQ